MKPKDRSHYKRAASEITPEERQTLRKLVGTGTMQSYKLVKKAMMAESSAYINGRRYI